MWFFRAIWFCLVLGVAFSNGANAASPSDTTIPPASEIIDSAGNVWTLVNSYPLENGNSTAASGFSELLFYNGNIYGYARSGNWSQWYGFASGGWANVSGNPSGGGPTSPPRPFRPPRSSSTAPATSGPWSTPTPLRTANPRPHPASVSCSFYNGNIYGYASSGNWSQWSLFASGAWTHFSGNPQTGPTGPTGPSTAHLGQAIPASLFGIQTQGASDFATVSFGVLGKGSGVAWRFLETSPGRLQLVDPRRLCRRRPSARNTHDLFVRGRPGVGDSALVCSDLRHSIHRRVELPHAAGQYGRLDQLRHRSGRALLPRWGTQPSNIMNCGTSHTMFMGPSGYSCRPRT